MHPYETHTPILTAYLKNIVGPVLELGGGPYSTPIFSKIASEKTPVYTLENHPDWYKSLTQYEQEHHKIIFCGAWVSNPWDNLPIKTWDVVFIDQDTLEARIHSIRTLKDRTKVFIVHDAEQEYYAEVFKEFPNIQFFKDELPWTAILRGPDETSINSNVELEQGGPPIKRIKRNLYTRLSES
jgi:hypothetical protein